MDEVPASGSYVAHKDNLKLGFWLFLGGEVVFFGVLIGTYLLFRIHNPADFEKVKHLLSIPLIAINTFILILSSFMVVRALESIRRGSVRGLRLNLLAVLGLGALFLGGQAYEWTSLFREGIGLATAFGTPFFTVTGIHGTHVFVGLLWSIYLLILTGKGAFSKNSHQGVEVFGLYWHFVDVVWIVLFTVFYLI
jgi:heme/copper-type cytochrome/quinol oxidase subunit 3